MPSSLNRFLNLDSQKTLSDALARSGLYWVDYKIRWESNALVYLTRREFSYTFLLYSGIPPSVIRGYYGIKEKPFHKTLQTVNEKMSNNEYTSDFFLLLFKKTVRISSTDGGENWPLKNLNTIASKMLPKKLKGI